MDRMEVDSASDGMEGVGEGGRDEEPALGVKIVVREGREGVLVDVRWLVGRDSVLFESFCGMLRREVTKGGKGG